MSSDGFPYPVDRPGNFSADPRPDDPADGERDLPEEIERAIAAFGLVAFADGRNGDCQALEDQARSTLTTSILSRLTAAEAGREEAEKERDAWKAQVESWQATAQDEAEIGNERRSEADAVRARVEKLERALRGLVFYAGQIEALVYDPTDTGEKDVMVEARAALTEAQPKGDQ